MYLRSLIFLFLLLSCFHLNSFSQTGSFTDSFDSNKGWKFAVPSDADSAEFKFENGKMIISNRFVNKRLFIEYTPLSSLDLLNDVEWDCTVQIQHLSGVSNYEYGICIGSEKDKLSENGIKVGISANGSYRISRYANKRNEQIKPWAPFSAIKKGNDSVNELRIIKRPYNNLYLLINNNWAFMGTSAHTGGNTFNLYVDAQQSIAVDLLTIKSFKGQFNKVEKHRIIDFLEVCRYAENNFALARGFESNGQFKSWLAPVTFFNQNYLINNFGKGAFPASIKDTASKRYVYTISQNYSNDESGKAYLKEEKLKLVSMIENGLKDFSKSELQVKDRLATFYFSKSSEVPQGIIVWLEEYEFLSKQWLAIYILHAPDIAPF